MCDNNNNEILNLDFTSIQDETNWTIQSGDTLTSQNQRLNFVSSNETHYIERVIGTPNSSNNRLNFQCVFDISKTVNNTNGFSVLFQIVNVVGNIIFECSEIINSTNQTDVYSFNTKRHFQYNGALSELKIRIKIQNGIENTMKIKTLKVDDFNLCLENIKTYFVLDSILLKAIENKFGIINLKTWKEEGIETLTQDFFIDNNFSNDSQPTIDWFFCVSEIDGTNRVSEQQNPISWNPFVKEFGLIFSNTNYYDGKPTGVSTGKNYGQAIMNIGIDIPLIINGSLNEKTAPFFIDFDFTKDVEISFDVIMSNDEENIFNRTTVWREYWIKWNKTTCRSEFYYIDKLNKDQFVDQTENGFLFGISGNINEVFETDGNGNVKKIEIAPGNCSEWVFGQPIFTEVYIQNSNIGYTPQNGDIVYIDQNFTQVFDGSAGHSYRMRTETSNPSILEYVFNISKFGEIINLGICSPDEEVFPPVIHKIQFPSYNSTQLNICIEVFNDGGGTLSECGVVFNTTGNPTILDNKEEYLTQLGYQCKVITRPVPGQQYYFSAYAINEAGVTYRPYNHLI